MPHTDNRPTVPPMMQGREEDWISIVDSTEVPGERQHLHLTVDDATSLAAFLLAFLDVPERDRAQWIGKTTAFRVLRHSDTGLMAIMVLMATPDGGVWDQRVAIRQDSASGLVATLLQAVKDRRAAPRQEQPSNAEMVH